MTAAIVISIFGVLIMLLFGKAIINYWHDIKYRNVQLKVQNLILEAMAKQQGVDQEYLNLIEKHTNWKNIQPK